MLLNGALIAPVIGAGIEVRIEVPRPPGPGLRLGGYRIGLLMNFNALRLKDGLRRFVMVPPRSCGRPPWRSVDPPRCSV